MIIGNEVSSIGVLVKWRRADRARVHVGLKHICAEMQGLPSGGALTTWGRIERRNIRRGKKERVKGHVVRGGVWPKRDVEKGPPGGKNAVPSAGKLRKM